MITVLIADDQELVRTGFRSILEKQPDLEVVGEAADGAEAVRLAGGLRPDVVLMDILMPVLDGLAATRQLLQMEASSTRVVVLTTFDLDRYVYEALKSGASGFLLKDSTPEQLAHAIRTVADGGAMLSPALTRRLIEGYVRRPSGADGNALAVRRYRLTDREVEIWKQLTRGLSNAEIGAAVHVSEATVKTHITRLFDKLQVRDRLQAAVLAYEIGVVQPGQTTTAQSNPRT